MLKRTKVMDYVKKKKDKSGEIKSEVEQRKKYTERKTEKKISSDEWKSDERLKIKEDKKEGRIHGIRVIRKRESWGRVGYQGR